MATVSGAPPTALERLRTSMRQNGEMIQQQRNLYAARREDFRASVRNFLQEQQVDRVAISRRDLQELTDVQFFASHNFVNFCSFACVLSVTFSLGIMGWGEDHTAYKMIHDQHQTLLTPVFWSYSMLIVIFCLEGVFVLCQLTNAYKHLSIVEEAIGFWFFAVNCCQLGWIISYSFGVIWLSTLFMLINVGFLSVLNMYLYNQEYVNAPRRGDTDAQAPPPPREAEDLNIVTEYVVFRAPFQIHCAWALFILLVQVNEFYVERELPAASIVALSCLILLWILGLGVLFVPRYPLFIMPFVVAWGAMGIWVELSNPRTIVLQDYDQTELRRMKGAAIATCIEHLLLPLIRFAFHFATTYNVTEKEDDPIPTRV